jgi:glutamyl/glutaminyl-tRNA synthetase
VIKESKAIKDIHRIREEFWRKTRGKSRESIVSLIKEESQKVKQELENVEPDSRLIIRRRYPIPQADSMEEIHQIRERGEKYEK